tara:strand:- start:2156 stop:2278 length:123 start_codon:yes stop_codon:yes gene_type:complete
MLGNMWLVTRADGNAGIVMTTSSGMGVFPSIILGRKALLL